ncbi:MAG: DUF1177 domain-containing protein [Patescibacteria group bacterium]|nr:DUF1177 domain-containing protein [Patescibacteria group bacterium]
MVVREILEIFEIISKPEIDIKTLKEIFEKYDTEVEFVRVDESKKTKPPIGGGKTIFIKIKINSSDKNFPKIGIIGQLGGIGARPAEIGFVSDGDGALSALACALKLAKMKYYGERIRGRYVISTHLCPNAPTFPKKPVSFMGSPVSLETMNKLNVEKDMEAIITIDTTRGNRIIKNNYFAITPIVKEGWILKIPDEVIDVFEWITGENVSVVPITMQDITPYTNNLPHINSILQPAIATSAPVLGVAITSKKVIPGSATGVTNLFQIDTVCRFIIEISKRFCSKQLYFYNKEEFLKLKSLYGSMTKLYK